MTDCHGKLGWRSYVQINGESKREYGCVRLTKTETVEKSLAKVHIKFSAEEADRIREMAGALDAPVEKDNRPTADQFVPIVHQVYGQHRDGKPMNKLFK